MWTGEKAHLGRPHAVTYGACITIKLLLTLTKFIEFIESIFNGELDKTKFDIADAAIFLEFIKFTQLRYTVDI